MTRRTLNLGASPFERSDVTIEALTRIQLQGLMSTEESLRNPAIGPNAWSNTGLLSKGQSIDLLQRLAMWRCGQLGEGEVFRHTLAPDALVVLKRVAERKDHREFAHLARSIEWSRYRPTDLIQAIDLALALDMVHVARELTQKGRQLFPQNEQIRRAAVVLSPPVVLETRPSQTQDLEVSHRWMREHSSQYKGQWVAVRGGTFLGSAPTLNALYQHIGPARHDANTIVVRVLG